MKPAGFRDIESELHAAASSATGGLDDFGEPDNYMPGFRQLLHALDNDGPRFTPEGRAFVRNSLTGILISRLLTEQGWKDNFRCLEQPISRPLIITGMPRTGTTALHKLLAEDPQFQGLERWLASFPQPRPPRESWPENPWHEACRIGLDEFFALAPDMRAAHDMRPDDVDECLEVLKQDFCSNYFGSTFRVPQYDDWWLRQSEAGCYRRLHRVLQLVGANSPDKTWLLKNPGHITQLNSLLAIFPDARIVQTHRNPLAALPSLCSVLSQARGITEGGSVNLEEIGVRELAFWSKALDKADKDRKAAPDRVIDVNQTEIHRDPMAVVGRIYRTFGLRLSSETEAAMRNRVARDPERHHGRHEYNLEKFGLTETIIKDRFAGYLHRHPVS